MNDTEHAQPTPGAASNPATDSIAASRDNAQTIVVNLPKGLGSFFGLGSVISVLMLFAAWMIVGIGYLCVPGSLVGAVLGIALGFMNLGNGLASAALCLGCGIACLGMCLPLLRGTQAARRALAKRTHAAFSDSGNTGTDERRIPRPLKTSLLIASLAIMVAGAAIAGMGTLAGGAETLYLPDFLRAIFN